MTQRSAALGGALPAALRHALVAALGGAFAFALFACWRLEGRWFAIAVVAVLLCAGAMVQIARLGDFLLVALLCSVPLAGFTKWIGIKEYPELIRDAAPVSGALGVGLTDFLLLGLYALWFARVFITREQRLRPLEGLDVGVLGLVAVYAVSAFGAPSAGLAIGATAYLVKHVLVYFYVSRHVERRHLPWLLGGFAGALALEGALGLFQNRTGRLRGLILDKGAGGSELDTQYAVPGIEELHRATGTTWDSHALGLYLCMLLPFALVLCFDARRAPGRRVAWGGLAALGALTLALTYSRSAWLSAAAAGAVAAAGLHFALRERGVLAASLAVCGVGALAAPWLLSGVLSRLLSAPGEIMTTRYEQWSVAARIWLDYPFFGHGAGNYMMALREYNQDWALELPVHNVLLFVGADTGLAGVLAFFGVIAAALRRCARVVRLPAEPERRLALACAAALVAYLVDGLTDPLFRECTVYLMFWLTIALSVALPRLAESPGEASRA